MEKLGTRKIVDLCSGGGGPLLAVQGYMRTESNFPTMVTLTDLYPNLAAFERAERESDGSVGAHRGPVSAYDVPPELGGIRTLFTAFHHFRPDDARRILLDARSKRCGIAIFEPFERSFRMARILGIAGIARGLLLTPKVGRMSIGRFVLTYVVPVGPAVVAWDGVVSALRSYTVPELRDLAASVEGDDFAWEAGQVPVATPVGPMPLTYLVGLPT